MKNKYKAVIFDLDGTLLDTLESIAAGANAVLKELGYFPLSVENYRSIVGNGARELIKQALYAAGDKEHKNLDRALILHKRAYEKYALYKVTKYDGIDFTLNRLKEMGIYIAVNSNKPEERAIGVLNELFGENKFDIIVGQTEFRPRKPDPAGCLFIADRLCINTKQCIYVGDTKVDMHTGRAAGMFTVGAQWGFRTRKELFENGADIVIENPSEILDILDKQ